jgi:hypothetical protein
MSNNERRKEPMTLAEAKEVMDSAIKIGLELRVRKDKVQAERDDLTHRLELLKAEYPKVMARHMIGAVPVGEVADIEHEMRVIREDLDRIPVKIKGLNWLIEEELKHAQAARVARQAEEEDSRTLDREN